MEDRRRMAGRENARWKNSRQKVGKWRDRWTIWLGKKVKDRLKASPGGHMGPSVQLKGRMCLCSWKFRKEEVKKKMWWRGQWQQRGLPQQRQQRSEWWDWCWTAGCSWSLDRLWKSACLPAASCCVQRPTVTAQGSELMTRAGSSIWWIDAEQWCEVVYSSRAQLPLTVSSSTTRTTTTKKGWGLKVLRSSHLSSGPSATWRRCFLPPREWERKRLSCTGDKRH